MSSSLRGADLVMRALDSAGCARIFTLSGNHIMSLFDAAIETGLDLIHVRQEAAAVHMADAWGRLTGRPGIAMVTGGPGHANAVPALFTARAQDAPLVLLSGHAGTGEWGRGGFQELDQAALAAPLAKASWTATRTEDLPADLARAFRIATQGRPGPVHLSLPSDVLDRRVDPATVTGPGAWSAPETRLPDAAADAVLGLLAAAERPLVVAGPRFSGHGGRAALARLRAALGIPAVVMESPRGAADASGGALGALLGRADLILLLGKPLDFTLRFGALPGERRWAMIDPEAAVLERAARENVALAFATLADSLPAALAARAGGHATARPAWAEEAGRLLRHRPTAWATLTGAPGAVHPAAVCRAVAPLLDGPDSILICDGGEFAQWGQSLLAAPRRLVNGVAGSIGSAIPFALAARVHEPRGNVVALLGDGTFGFHMAEFETAARRGLPFVAVVGTDARWNAEHNLQLRDYGANRAVGCDLTAARYDLVAAALGGHGEYVETAEALPAALDRARASGKPACVNVRIASVAGPVLNGSET
jgi:acetolactate synthase-1/2/3 large subunit